MQQSICSLTRWIRRNAGARGCTDLSPLASKYIWSDLYIPNEAGQLVPRSQCVFNDQIWLAARTANGVLMAMQNVEPIIFHLCVLELSRCINRAHGRFSMVHGRMDRGTCRRLGVQALSQAVRESIRLEYFASVWRDTIPTSFCPPYTIQYYKEF